MYYISKECHSCKLTTFSFKGKYAECPFKESHFTFIFFYGKDLKNTHHPLKAYAILFIFINVE